MSSFWGVDPYADSRKDRRIDAELHYSQYEGRAALKKMTSVEAAAEAERNGVTFDFIYIDGSHRAKAVKEDIEAWYPRLNRPGVFAGHDYIDGMKSRGADIIGVVNEFAEHHHLPLYLTGDVWASWFVLCGTDYQPKQET
jgi:hypothetical protein